jgi:aromatic amino acid aminotransferase I
MIFQIRQLLNSTYEQYKHVSVIFFSFFKAMSTFMNPGERFITEEWTYPSALATASPFGVYPVAIAMDGEGMRSDSLREMLQAWDEEQMGAKR